MSSEWSNAETLKMWVLISNSVDYFTVINTMVPIIYHKHTPCSVFSRRDNAAVELGDFIKSVVQSELYRCQGYSEIHLWAKDLLQHSLGRVNWTEMARVLIENHESAYNIESTL